MKKLAAVVLSAAILLLTTPLSVHAISSDTEVINKHGTRTYMGTYSAWSEGDWDSDNFTDVTGEDVDCSDTLVIKDGKLGDVTVSDGASLTIYDGTMSDVVCDGSISMSGGTVNSLESDEDIDISGGVIQSDIDAEDVVTLSGKLTVGGSVTGTDVTVYATSSSGYTAVSGDVVFSDLMTMTGTKYQFGGIDGQSSGTLVLKSFTGALPDISDVTGISVDSGSTVTTNSSLDLDTLTIEDDSEFATTSTLTVSTITGPGTLIFNAGNLTIESGVTEEPVFDFNGTAQDGTAVFKAGSGDVSTGDITVYGYSLSKQSTSGSYDNFILESLSGNGVTLNTASVSVGSGGYATVQASVTPSLSQLADGTKLYWKLIDSSTLFSITPDTSNNTCRIYLSSSAGASAYKATLAVYLVDSSGDILSGYQSDSCAVTSSGSTSSGTAASGISLDTATVSIPIGSTYYVLAITNSQTPPVQMSYNSAIAVVGKPTAYNSNGKTGWVYPVTALAKGGVTINIGGQTMIATVPSGSIIVDTSSYTLSPGKTYIIGVKLNGAVRSSLNVHSANSCTTVQYKGRASNGVELYSIKANSVGTGYVFFDTAAGGSVKTQINVVNGAASQGVGAKLTAIA